MHTINFGRSGLESILTEQNMDELTQIDNDTLEDILKNGLHNEHQPVDVHSE